MEKTTMANGKDHWLRRLMDNPWMLLFLGFFIPFLSYTIWGWIEVFTMPMAKLP